MSASTARAEPVAAPAAAPAPVSDAAPGADARPGQNHRPTSRGDRLVVLYDRDCGLCTATARRLRWLDGDRGRLDLVPLQDAPGSGRPALESMARHYPLSASLHVLDERTGAIRAGGDAVLAIAARLPGGRMVAGFGRLPPFRRLICVGYDRVARNRHRIGRWLRLEGPACDLPR